MRRTIATNTPLADGWVSPPPQLEAPVLAREDHELAGTPWTPPQTLERFAALALLVVAVPILAVLFLLVLVADGRPVLYRGWRLGLRKRPFLLFKVRTLRRDAPQWTAERLLDARDGLEIRGGRLLRDSRLDELPQLWNIVRGEMSFVGPRPEREQVYRLHCASIPGYARRFAVRPGMLGPSQLFTPHATPKRIRAWLDNAWSRRERSIGGLVCLTTFTVLVAGRKSVQRALEAAWNDLVQVRVLRRYREKRRLRRVEPEGAVATLVPAATALELHGVLVDLNEEALLVRSPRAVPAGTSVRLRVATEIAGGSSAARIRHATCTAVVRQQRRCEGGTLLVLEYRPATARSHYVLHQYFLRNALACPRALGSGRRRLATDEVLREGSLHSTALPLAQRVFIPGPVLLHCGRACAGTFRSALETRR